VERILTGYGFRAFFAIYDPGPTLGGIIGGVIAAVIGFSVGVSGDTPVNDETAPPDRNSDSN